MLLLNDVVCHEAEPELLLSLAAVLNRAVLVRLRAGEKQRREKDDFGAVLDIGLVSSKLFSNRVELSEELHPFSCSEAKEKNLGSLKRFLCQSALCDEELPERVF